jgi:hypothetical protein
LKATFKEYHWLVDFLKEENIAHTNNLFKVALMVEIQQQKKVN